MLNQNSENLRKLMKNPGIISAPGVWDGFSAKLVEYMGFKAAYASGAMISHSILGKPDVGLVTMTEMVTQLRNIANAISIPVISDADTGYGNAVNVMRTVREFEQAGVAGIHLEDQELPKRCGHLSGKRIVPKEEMVGKIKAAVDARRDESFVIIARTDAKGVYGLEDAIDRGNAYAEAGADMLFIEALESVEELRKISSSFPDIPLLVVMGGKKSPALSNSQLEALGYKIAIYPGEMQRVAAKAILDIMKPFQEKGDSAVLQGKQLTFEEHFDLMGVKEYYAAEAKYLGSK